MNTTIITTFLILIGSVVTTFAQTKYTSNINVEYEFDQSLNRTQLAENEQNCSLVIDADNKTATLTCGNAIEQFNITHVDELHLESGIIYTYDITTSNGYHEKLEVNTKKNVFTFKPLEVKAGTKSRKFFNVEE